MLAGFLVFVIDGFKSYHYGIEIGGGGGGKGGKTGFKSYHYGIEMAMILISLPLTGV